MLAQTIMRIPTIEALLPTAGPLGVQKGPPQFDEQGLEGLLIETWFAGPERIGTGCSLLQGLWL